MGKRHQKVKLGQIIKIAIVGILLLGVSFEAYSMIDLQARSSIERSLK